jgi:hypothetical protein
MKQYQMSKLKVQMNIRISNDKTMGKKAFFDRQVPLDPGLWPGSFTFSHLSLI